MRTQLWLIFLALVIAGSAQAHKGSDAYLDVQQIDGASQAETEGKTPQRTYRFSLAVAIKDLDLLVPIDANADGNVTWGEVKAALPMVLALLNQAANTEAPADPESAEPGSPPECRLTWQFDGVDRRGDGTYLRMVTTARCPTAHALAFRYKLFANQDATHRLLVAGRIAGQDLLTTASPQQARPLILSPGAHPGPDLAMQSAVSVDSRWSVWRDYFSLGMHHLLEGYDHLAFLLALVLPLRLRLFNAASAPRRLRLLSSAPPAPQPVSDGCCCAR